MLRTGRCPPPWGFRGWARARGVTPRRRQPATRLPGNYLDGTLTRWRRRAYGHTRSNHRAHRPSIPSRAPSGHAVPAPATQELVEFLHDLFVGQQQPFAVRDLPDPVTGMLRRLAPWPAGKETDPAALDLSPVAQPPGAQTRETNPPADLPL